MVAERIAEKIKGFTALVVGLGGLGGSLFEHLLRIGFKKITAADGDTFSESNLNRQILCTKNNIGQPKALAARKRAEEINGFSEVEVYCCFVDEENINEIAAGADIVFDCCDNVKTRLLLEKYCASKGIPLVHGAINDVFGQISVVMPGSGLLEKMYASGSAKTSLTLSYVPAVVAGIQAGEGVKILCGEGECVKNKVLLLDFLNNSFDII